MFSFKVDESLSFLDGLVAEALSNGSSPYKPMSERSIENKTKGEYVLFSVLYYYRRNFCILVGLEQ